MSPCGGLTICTTAAFCVASPPAARGEDARLLCLEIYPPSMFTFNFHSCSFIFICQSPSPLSFETPFLLSVSPLSIFFPFSSPPVSSLYSFHLATPMAHPHSISSLTPYNLVPAFPLLLPSVSRKHKKKCSSILLSQSFLPFLQIIQTSGEFLTHSTQPRTNSGTLLHKVSIKSKPLWAIYSPVICFTNSLLLTLKCGVPASQKLQNVPPGVARITETM